MLKNLVAKFQLQNSDMDGMMHMDLSTPSATESFDGFEEPVHTKY